MEVSLTVLLLLVVRFSHCQEITWTWLSGSGLADTVLSDVEPGSRSGAAFWMQQGHEMPSVTGAPSGDVSVWMFGGESHDYQQPDLKNDLWRYDIDTMTWNLIKNGSTESTNLIPEPRQLAAGCGLKGAYFVLFGGHAAGEQERVLGDTWLYYIPDRKWYTLNEIKVKLGANNMSHSDQPQARGDMAVWCHSDQEMIIFGGFGGNQTLLHDLWRFNLQTLSWHQSELSAKLPTDQEFIKNLRYPSGRSGATTWVVGDKLFMFGGNISPNNVRSNHQLAEMVAEMWEYDSTKDIWYCNSNLQPEIASEVNYPGCRRQAASWVDSNGNLWMFGGEGANSPQSRVTESAQSLLLSDIWFFDTRAHIWTRKGGNENGDQKKQVGTIGKSSMDATASSRFKTIFWNDWNYLYLFGGIGHDSRGIDGYLGDIWKIDIHLDPSVLRNAPHPGPVLALVFLGLGMISLTAVFFLLSRNFFLRIQDRKLKYSKLSSDAANEF